MPEQVHLDLSRALRSLPEDGHTARWVELPAPVRTIEGFESLLRSRQWGSRLFQGRLQFLRAGGLVEDTGCLMGDIVEVVAVTGGQRAAGVVAVAAQEPATAKRNSGSSEKAKGAQSTAEAAAAAKAAATVCPEQEQSAAAAAVTVAGQQEETTGPREVGGFGQQPVVHLSRPERL